MAKKTFLGTDVSKDTLDFSLIFEDQPENFHDLRVTNNPAGYAKLVKWLKKLQANKSHLITIMEHTGAYTLDFVCFLDEQNLDFVLFPALEIKRSLGITRGKNDKVDARRIATYGFMIRHKIKPSKIPSVDIVKLKQLLSVRMLLVRQRTSTVNALKAQQKFNKYTQITVIETELQDHIKGLNIRINEIEKELGAIVKNSAELKKNFELLCSITGVGPVIAYALIAYTNNFNNFSSARKFMSYVGVAPFEQESGQHKSKKKICSLANKRLKALLHNGASCMKVHDPEARAYYNRKIQEGKHKRQVANALAGKLITRIFAVIKRETNFVSLYSQKIPHKKVA